MKKDMLEMLGNLDDALIAESTWENYEKKHGKGNQRHRISPKKLLPLMLAAALVMGLGGVAAAATTDPNTDVKVLRFMGLDSKDSTQLADGTVQLAATDTAKGTCYVRDGAYVEEGYPKSVTVNAGISVGDEKNACIRFDTDLPVPEDYDPATDYLYFADWSQSLFHGTGKEHKPVSGYGGTAIAEVEDGKVYFLVYLQGVEKLNTATVNEKIGNIIWAKKNGEQEVKLFDGSWELDWTYSYLSNKRICRVNETVNAMDGSFRINKVEITPLSVTVSGIGYRNLMKDYLKSVDGIDVTEVILKDGTHISGGSSVMGASRRLFRFTYTGQMTTSMQGIVLDPNEVEAVVANGIYIEL